jgi:hypothetical protein
MTQPQCIEGVDGDLIQAVAYCRLGRTRPVSDASFNQAKALGLLAQDPCWRATDRGEGVLVAAGLMKGSPAAERIVLAVRWAVCKRYSRPQLVKVWTEWAYEHVGQDEIDEADQEFRAYGDETDWKFWTAYTHVDVPRVPSDVAGSGQEPS